MVIITAGALNATLWMMQQQDKIAIAVTEKSGADLDRLNEKIYIADTSESTTATGSTLQSPTREGSRRSWRPSIS